MNNNSANKKYKRPKQKTQSTTNPEPSRLFLQENRAPEIPYPLAAKDSEWVDILQSPGAESATPAGTCDEEEVLQLVECEDGPQMKPLAIMFPDLLEKDPNTLEGVLNKAMSTTEVTRHLVDLGQKANFTFMKKADRLIPRDKHWLASLTENSNSITSLASGLLNFSVSSDYDAVNEVNKYEDGTPQQNEIRADTVNTPEIINTRNDSNDNVTSMGRTHSEINKKNNNEY